MNHDKKKKRLIHILSFILLTCFIAGLLPGCTGEAENSSELSNQSLPVSADVDALLTVTESDSLFTAEDKEIGYSDTDSSVINLSEEKIFTDAYNVEIDGSTATVTSAGTYIITGNLTGGSIIINSDDDSEIRLVLSGVNIESSSASAIQVENAGKVYITLAENTENFLSGDTSFSQSGENDGVIYSKSDLTLNGRGSLSISSTSASGIVSEKNITITGGTINISAGGYGISASESVRISSAMISVDSDDSGIYTYNEKADSSGFIYISDGIFNINSAGSAVDAKSILLIEGGAFNINSTGGYSSGYGLSAGEEVSVSSGEFVLYTADSALNSGSKVSVNGGTFTIYSGNNGIEGKSTVLIGEAKIDILKSYIGIEGETVYIHDAALGITSDDDGINAAGGNDGSGLADGEEAEALSSSAGIRILSGNIDINASGDGIDSARDISVSDGTIFISSADSEENAVIDYSHELYITGGTILAVGNSPRENDFFDCEQPIVILDAESETQYSYIEITDESGNIIISGTSGFSYSSVLISSSQLQQGQSYTMKTDNSSVIFSV